MALRVCAEPGCPELTRGTRCPEHESARRRAQDEKRGSFRQRGYDKEYVENRKRVLAEEGHCWICGKPVDKTLPGTHPKGPSADHVVRREDGGTNERSNLRLAHLGCNSGRSRG